MPPTKVTGEKIIKAEPRDVFLHLLAIITLYASALSLGALLFNFISIYIPDPINIGFQTTFLGGVRWSLAWLVVVFPAYLWVTSYLEKDLAAHPQKRELRARKWLLNLTLFLAALVIGSDLVAAIFSYLSGELTLRFFLKTLVVLGIAAAVFRYYLWNLRETKPAFSDPRLRILAWGVIAVVASSIIAGFAIAGSPAQERLRRFDELRVQDLVEIQFQVDAFWRQEKRLPNSLAQLEAVLGYTVPTDPQTKEGYEYKILGDKKYELCAFFRTESGGTGGGRFSQTPPPGEFDSWEHGAGRACFTHTVVSDPK